MATKRERVKYGVVVDGDFRCDLDLYHTRSLTEIYAEGLFFNADTKRTSRATWAYEPPHRYAMTRSAANTLFRKFTARGIRAKIVKLTMTLEMAHVQNN